MIFAKKTMIKKINILLAILAIFSCSLLKAGEILTSRTSSVTLEIPQEQESFSFAIVGDRTSGKDSGLLILDSAVKEINLVSPDLVITMGDYIQGYGGEEQWLSEAQVYRDTISRLEMPWFPVAGNHEVYWRGSSKPQNEHEETYEKFFGPLWYAFEHKNSWFIVLFSDEGDQENFAGKNFSSPKSQLMSPAQTEFLKDTLKKAKNADHIFVFIHHPRWLGQSGIYNYGEDWDRVHEILKAAGNVTACFASHLHQMRFDGTRDGIEYYSLACVGANIPDEKIDLSKGYLHEYTLVSIKGGEYHIAAVPVETVFDPKTEYMSNILKEKSSWVIRTEEQRELSYPIDIPTFSERYPAKLRIGIRDGADNNGDRGVVYQLCKEDGRLVASGLLTSEGTEWVEYEVKPSEHFEFKLIDEDTSFEGKYPGNAGDITIELIVKIR